MSKTLPIGDFSGGLTDYTFTRGQTNLAVKFDNWLINPDGSIECRPGFDVRDMSHPRVPANARISKLYQLGSSLLAVSGKSLYENSTEIVGPTGNKALFNGGLKSKVSIEQLGDQYFVTDDNRSYPVKLFRDNSGNIQLRSSGLPEISTTPTLVNSHLESKSYLYAAVYSYTFLAGTTEYKDISRPVYFGTQNGPDMDLADRYVQIDNLPVLSNLTTHNWDEVNIKVEIYRTPSTDSSTYYYVGQVDNGVTTFTDSTTDDELTTRELFYISLGYDSNDAPPRAKYIVQSNNAIWYLNLLDNGQERTNRIRQSIQNDGDSCPYSWFTEVDSEITGGASINDRIIVFTKDKTYRIDGVLTEGGGGSITPETIDDEVGCISHASIIKTSSGLYFASQDGFYKTDGYKTSKVSELVDETYKIISVRPQLIDAAYDNINKRIYWAVSIGSSEADRVVVYHEKTGGFTTMSGESLSPSALLFDGSNLIHGDSRGFIMRHDKSSFSDRKIDLLKLVSDWVYEPIVCTWKSVAMDAGVFDHFKFWNKVSIGGKPETNVDVLLRSYNEGIDDYKELTPTNHRPQLIWGDGSVSWGELVMWNRVEFLNKTRRFPKGGLRAKHKQVEITNAYVKIVGSTTSEDSYVTVNSAGKTASLLNPSDYTMLGGNVGYDLVINGKSYPITASTASSVTVEDPTSSLVDGVYPWEIKGIPKGQRPHIHSLILYYTVMDNDGQFPGAPA